MDISLSAEHQILAVMLGLQLLESFRSVDRGGLAFLRTARGFRLRRLSEFLAVPGRRNSLAPLLPPLYEHVALQPPPWTTDGRYLFAPAGFDAEARPPRRVPQRVFDLNTLEHVDSDGSHVLLDGRKAYSMGDEKRAQEEAAWMAAFAAKSPNDRVQAFADRRRDELTIDPLLATWRERLPLIDRLRRVSTLQWLIQWLVVPAIVWHYGFQASILVAFPLWWLAACGTSIAYLAFAERHGKIEGLSGRALSIFFCPPLGYRLQDRLWQPLVAHRHPLAVARAFLNPQDFQSLAERWRRDLEHPPAARDAIESALATAFQTEAAILRDWLDGNSLAPTQSQSPAQDPLQGSSPVQSEALPASTCPRCQAPHRPNTPICQDCAVTLTNASSTANQSYGD